MLLPLLPAAAAAAAIACRCCRCGGPPRAAAAAAAGARRRSRGGLHAPPPPDPAPARAARRGLARHLCAARLEAARAAGARGAGARPLLGGAGGCRGKRGLRSVARARGLERLLRERRVQWGWRQRQRERQRGWRRLGGAPRSRATVPLLSCLQVACGDGLVRIYNFLRSDEPSQYPQVRLPVGQGGAGDAAGQPHATTLKHSCVPLSRFLPCPALSCPAQDRMDRSKEVTPADVTRGALDKSDPVAGAPPAPLRCRLRAWAAACALPPARCRLHAGASPAVRLAWQSQGQP